MSSDPAHGSSPDSLLCVLVATPADAAEPLASGIVEQQLAACVQVTGIRSCYRWQGVVERADESLLVIKTTRAAYPTLERWLQREHPYDVPEIIALPVVEALPDYREWLVQNVKFEQ